MAGYRLNKLKDGTHIAYWPDPRGPGHGYVEKGTVIGHLGDTISIAWYAGPHEGVDERWLSSDLRYRVDRGQVILKAPPKPRRFRKPKKDDSDSGQKVDRQLLTSSTRSDMIEVMIGENSLTDTTKGVIMAARKKAATVVEEPEELEELEELEESTEDAAEAGGDKLTAKAAATKLGTDGRTLRKFLRKQHGTVGQGQRWEIDASDIDQLKVDFDAWSKGGRSDKKTKSAPEPDAPDADELEEIDELDELEG